MAQNEAPNPPRREFQFVDLQTGYLTPYALNMLDEYWRQLAAGFTFMPCEAEMATNVITLFPRLHGEGARTYGDGMAYTFVAPDTSTGNVTALVKAKGDTGTSLDTVKVMKTGGTAQAGAGDVDADHRYIAIYDATVDAGAGGFVLFASI